MQVEGYGGLVNRVAFALGHLGTEASENMLSLWRTGVLSTVRINTLHFNEVELEAFFRRLRHQVAQTVPEFETIFFCQFGKRADGTDELGKSSDIKRKLK
ncbi:MAG: hypothetical protein OXN84_04820 [Albidovulum sp.]|nr:hypothetical protein [Albidovulum sp.]